MTRPRSRVATLDAGHAKKAAASAAATIAAAALLSAALVSLSACNGLATGPFDADWAKALEREHQQLVDKSVPPEPLDSAGTPIAELAHPILDAADPNQPVELSLEQVVVLALGRNRELAVAQLNPIIIGTFELTERGRFDPEVFANAGLTFDTTDHDPAIHRDGFEIGAGVRQRLPTGTEIELGATFDQFDASNRDDADARTRLGLTVTQSLLRGFGPTVNLVSVRQAELRTLASHYELRGFVEALLAETEATYWRYVLAGRQIDIFVRSLEVARTQADQAQQRVEVGTLPATELAAFEAEVALREQALIDANASRDLAKLELLRRINALGPPAWQNRSSPNEPATAAVAASVARNIVPTSIPDREPDPVDEPQSHVELALRMRPDLNESKLLLERDRLEVIATADGLLPRLDLFIALGKSGYASNFGRSLERIDGPSYDATVGLTLSQHIGRNTATGDYTRSLAVRRQAARAVSNLEQLIVLDVLTAINELERATQQIAASKKTRELQAITAQAEVERFEAGVSTSLLVAQAQRDLLEAEIAEVAAIINYRLARIRLYLADGTLLERRGINIPMIDR